jgi:hypothetical protein
MYIARRKRRIKPLFSALTLHEAITAEKALVALLLSYGFNSRPNIGGLLKA